MVEVLESLMIFGAVAAMLALFVWVSINFTVDTVDGRDWMERDVR